MEVINMQQIVNKVKNSKMTYFLKMKVKQIEKYIQVRAMYINNTVKTLRDGKTDRRIQNFANI